MLLLALLSGGIDSSLVSCAVKKALGGSLQTSNVRFHDVVFVNVYGERAFDYESFVILYSYFLEKQIVAFSRNEIEAAFNYSFSLVSEEKRPNIAAAHIMMSLQTGELN